ncbi:MAG: three-Cys-motif partner protein TcmP [Acidobacteriota bacterium]
MSPANHDRVGYWSEIKLEIVKKYASAYSNIMSNQPLIKRYLYIDAFAGSGTHISKRTGNFIPGSPLNALEVQPPFHEYHFIDLDGDKAKSLRQLAKDEPRAHVYEADCHTALFEHILPRCRYGDFHRALCVLDPYDLNPSWEIVKKIGQMQSVEIFLNFMIMDANMNVLWKNPERVSPEQQARMDRFWGDNSWRESLYRKQPHLFGFEELKQDNDAVAEAYRARLNVEAGFAYVPSPMPMRNSNGAVIYYLFFASPNSTGGKIVSEIFEKYRNRGAG